MPLGPLTPLQPPPDLVLGVDVGGTFTDFLLLDPASGLLRGAKVPTTTRDQSLGFMSGIAALDDAIKLRHATCKFREALVVGIATPERAFYMLGTNQDEMWRRYLERMAEPGASREPTAAAAEIQAATPTCCRVACIAPRPGAFGGDRC